MKKILIFSLAYYPRFVSGAEGAIKEITDRIEQSDIEFHMVTLRFDSKNLREERIGNVFVHRVGFGGIRMSKILFPILAAFAGLRLNRKHNFDAIWAMMTYMLFPVVLMRIMGSRVPHMLTLQDGDPYEKVFERWFIRPFAPILNYGFRSVVMIQVISSYLGTWAPRRGYKGDVVLVYNGANPRDIAADFQSDEIDDLKKKLGKKDGDIFLVNTARLVHQKAFDITLRALVTLPENVKFLIVGDGDEKQMLVDLVEELKLTARVIFTGKVDRSLVSNYRQASDIFVGPSRSEGLGNAFLSAMASKLPVVATQEGGIAEFLFDKKHNPEKDATGWVVDKDSPLQIAEAVKDILANPEKVKEVTTTARKMVVEKFNWDNIAKEMREKVFEKIFNKTK